MSRSVDRQLQRELHELLESRLSSIAPLASSHADIATEPLSGCLAGTALKALLATIGITADNNCSCNARAREMDARGCDWCEANVDIIVGWLREEATKRSLPFLDAAGRLLVRRAIRNARRAASNDSTQNANQTGNP